MAPPSPDPPFRTAAEFREVLDDLLVHLNRDEKLAGVLCAARWRQSFEITDLDLRLDVAPRTEGEGGLRWTFDGDAEWEPKVTMKMSSAAAHDYLCGELNLPVGIARGLIKVEGEGPSRIKYVTLMTLLAVPYKQVIAEHYGDGKRKG